MLIKTLRLENFRQFKGTTKINFSCDAERNVTVILGNNTFGKTTLLQAFNWCFYGEVNFGRNDKFLLNGELAAQMSNGEQETVSVEVVLLHADAEYIITRTQRYTFGGGKAHGESSSTVEVLIKGADGQTKPIKNQKITELINNLLPKDLSTYFFFDTERISTISERRDIAAAVKNFLGLSALENASRHLGSRTNKNTVIGKIYSDLNLAGDARAKEALNKLQTAADKREDIAKQLDECNDQIFHFEERKAELETILRENKTTADLQKEADKLERQIKTDKRILDEAMENYFRDFSANALKFFIQPLLNQAENFLTTVKITEKGVRDVTRATIDELIRRGRCICGQEICLGNDAYRHLMDELAYVPPESIGVTVRHYREKLNGFSRAPERIYENIRQRHEEILRTKERIHEHEDDLDDKRKKIAGKENMARYENELSDILRRLRDLNARKDSLNKQDGALEQEIKQCQKELDKLTEVSEKNRDLQELLTYAEELKAWLEPTCRENERKLRESLTAEVNKIFDEMYHGHRRVELDEQYRVELIATVADSESLLSESEGLNRVKNFSFIAGLVALAKRQILKDSGIPSEAYPLVMDAPFSNADEIHTANISKVLPQIAEQVIMFVMQKDWNFAEPVMIQRVGKKYRLNKISETFTKIEEA
ncbi:MAG: AAA family ATPase [Selenomonadaceae bacterium]|nr:AAA family ATPase [Selenomonadaceae bacterium]